MTDIDTLTERVIRKQSRRISLALSRDPWRHRGFRVVWLVTNYYPMNVPKAYRVDISPRGTRRNGTLILTDRRTGAQRALPYIPQTIARSIYITACELIAGDAPALNPCVKETDR